MADAVRHVSGARRRRSPGALATGLLGLALLMAPAAAAHEGHGHGDGAGAGPPARAAAPPATPDPSPLAVGGPFSLLDHTGQRRSDADFRGSYLLIYFGYTECPYTCSITLAAMAATLDELGEAAARVQPIFITVDPEHDTPERLADFVSRIHPRLVGLTGTAAEVAAARRAYRVEARPAPESGAFERLIGHTPLLYLMGPDGGFLTLMPPVVPPGAMADIIRRYLS